MRLTKYQRSLMQQAIDSLKKTQKGVSGRLTEDQKRTVKNALDQIIVASGYKSQERARIKSELLDYIKSMNRPTDSPNRIRITYSNSVLARMR